MIKLSSMIVDKCLDICKKLNKKYYGFEVDVS